MKISPTLIVAVLASLTKSVSSESTTSCSDFEGLFEAIDVDDASTLKISVTCTDDYTAKVVYSDNRWSAPTCGIDPTSKKSPPNNGGPGLFTLDYLYNDDSIDVVPLEGLSEGQFNVTCEDGQKVFKDFGPNSFDLQDNGSLDWSFGGASFGFTFWRVSD